MTYQENCWAALIAIAIVCILALAFWPERKPRKRNRMDTYALRWQSWQRKRPQV